MRQMIPRQLAGCRETAVVFRLVQRSHERTNMFCRNLLVAAFLSAVIGCIGCANDRSVIDQAESMHGELQKAVINDPQLSNYLQQVGDRIIDAAKEADRAHVGPKSHFDKNQQDAWMFSQQMQFHFVNSKTLNAFTTGGEHMYIYNQLFQECQSEDELAAVM